MQAILKYIVKFLSQFIKDEDVIELNESDEPVNTLLAAVCNYALLQDISKVRWNLEDKTMSSADQKEFSIWFDKKDGEWMFRRVSDDGSHITTSFTNTPANKQLIHDTIKTLSNKGVLKLIEDFTTKTV